MIKKEEVGATVELMWNWNYENLLDNGGPNQQNLRSYY
jgi:hypothetical protein